MKASFKKSRLAMTVCGLLLSLTMFSSAAHANLIANGGFEESSNPTTTPTGWTNIGHSDGVIPYTIGPLPAYEGNYFYDLGGYGDASGPVGDGIMQTVNTTVGTAYKLVFGLSSEDVRGDSTLRVSINGAFVDFDLSSTGTWFLKGFTTETIDYVATDSVTTISFVETRNTSGGYNDPLIDCVVFDVAGAAGGCGSSHIPEPTSLALLGIAMAGLAGIRRRNKI